MERVEMWFSLWVMLLQGYKYDKITPKQQKKKDQIFVKLKLMIFNTIQFNKISWTIFIMQQINFCQSFEVIQIFAMILNFVFL